jgi:hypothetical protein
LGPAEAAPPARHVLQAHPHLTGHTMGQSGRHAGDWPRQRKLPRKLQVCRHGKAGLDTIETSWHGGHAPDVLDYASRRGYAFAKFGRCVNAVGRSPHYMVAHCSATYPCDPRKEIQVPAAPTTAVSRTLTSVRQREAQAQRARSAASPEFLTWTWSFLGQVPRFVCSYLQ